ncbi:uncharacterized protein N7482_001958, partial [Penicillium canariense]
RGLYERLSSITYTFRFNEVLDPSKLHSSLVKLFTIGDWRKLGGRLRRTDNGDIVIHVPKVYDAEHPAVRYSHVEFDIRIEVYLLGCRLPKETEPYPSVHEGCHTFRSFSRRQDLPGDIEHHYTSDEPLVSLRVTSFTDTTPVPITFPHSVCDAMGTAELLRAWSSVLASRIESVPAVLGASRDVIETMGTLSDEKAEKPYLLEHRQIKCFSLLAFIVRFVWDLLTRRNVQTRTIFLPASFLRKLRQEAQEQLAIEPTGRTQSFPQ